LTQVPADSWIKEINRLKAKALREQREASEHKASLPLQSENLAAGQKRPHPSSSTTTTTKNFRDARSAEAAQAGGFRPLDAIQPARNFAKYVEYDFSKMTDTKGGFMTVEDDPHNKALHARGAEEEAKPAHMTLKEWERHQLLKKLREQRSGPFEPSLNAASKDGAEQQKCRECGTLEIDYSWLGIFGIAICNTCKDTRPDKYSLLTKTEAKEDYLLTDPELRDPELLPHLERPNPHKATWNNMMLFLRFQVEEYAFSEKKWGSAEKLDEAFANRESERKRRKEQKFKSKLEDLKKKTRVEAWRRARKNKGGGEFGDDVERGGKHEHVWGQTIEDEESGMGTKTCVECGMEVEELIL
jgi:DNA-repair protein complementing XP-A cells